MLLFFQYYILAFMCNALQSFVTMPPSLPPSPSKQRGLFVWQFPAHNNPNTVGTILSPSLSCFTLHCHVCIGISNPSHFPIDGDNAKVMPGYPPPPHPCSRAGGGGGGGCQVVICLFDLILYVPSTIFQLHRDRSTWVEPVLS